MRGLDGKAIIVTGAAGTIGAETCRRLAAEGAFVVVSDVDTAGAETVATDIEGSGGRAVAFTADAGSQRDWQALIGFTVSVFGGLWGLYNNAVDCSPEIADLDGAILDVPQKVWERNLAVTLTGAFHGVRQALPEMVKAGGGAIVNTVSDATFNPEPFALAYAAASGGILPLTRHVARVYGKQGVRCNAVSPGVLTTTAARSALADRGVDVDAALAKTPTHRPGEARDVAAIVAHLMSADGEFITGQTWCVNGGRIMR